MDVPGGEEDSDDEETSSAGPAPRTHQYVCEDCQTDEDGNPVDKIRKTHGESNARLLADIHETKTGHNVDRIEEI